MVHKSPIFNFQKDIAIIRKNVAQENLKRKVFYEPLLAAITNDTELEDLRFYKEYLSGFDVEHELEGFKLACNPAFFDSCRDVAPLFLRFVAASFSSTYDLEYIFERDEVALTIHVSVEAGHETEKYEKLWPHIISRLFCFYLREQLNFDGFRESSEGARKVVDEKRAMLLVVFQKKVRMLKQQRERLSRNADELTDNLKSLDDLLGE